MFFGRSLLDKEGKLSDSSKLKARLKIFFRKTNFLVNKILSMTQLPISHKTKIKKPKTICGKATRIFSRG
jgi:hypothetical protein